MVSDCRSQFAKALALNSMNFVSAFLLCVLPVALCTMHVRYDQDVDMPDNMVMRDPRTGAYYNYDVPDNVYVRDPRTGLVYDAGDFGDSYKYKPFTRGFTRGHQTVYGYRPAYRAQSYVQPGVRITKNYIPTQYYRG
ncbi:uncharacterized protein LOC143274977 isoform X2 [Babylonia areolata]|uniref:uncharacterized protein LOC143274977 isoform X2 n=1 Tax=Babylonia areolata TaxID=304850 RepID=UPI003FCF250C